MLAHGGYLVRVPENGQVVGGSIPLRSSSKHSFGLCIFALPSEDARKPTTGIYSNIDSLFNIAYVTVLN